MIKVLIFLLIFTNLSVLSAITGESITGEISSQPTNVSIFVLPDKPVIQILSPENATYYSNSILVNYTIGNPINSVWYNLDSSGNISLPVSSFNSFFINVSFGEHLLNIFANNSFGESSSSVSFVSAEQIIPPSNGGGSGGGGGGGTKTISFSLDKELIKVSIKQGETKRETITITNEGNSILNLNLDAGELKEFVAISDEIFSLKPGEKKTINLDFFAREDEVPDSYFGEITIKEAKATKKIILIIEVKGKKPLFDLEIKAKSKILEPGDTLRADINAINLGDLRNFDILLHYAIRSIDGDTIVFKEESIAIDQELSVLRKLVVPENTPYGEYVLYSKITYGNVSASSTDIFEVVENKKATLNIYLALAILLILTALLIIYLKNKKYFKQVSSYFKSSGKGSGRKQR